MLGDRKIVKATLYVCMCVYFDSVVHYTSYVNNVRQIKQIQIHPEPRPTPECLEDCGWVLFNTGWPKNPFQLLMYVLLVLLSFNCIMYPCMSMLNLQHFQ